MSDSAGRTRLAPHPLLLFIVLLVLVLAIASFAVGRIPVNGLRPRIADAFERATGRALTIAGPLQLTLLPSPGLVADDVSIANLPGGTQPVMAHVDRLAAHVALVPLLSGEIRLVGLTLTDPSVLLERLPDGRVNWHFSPERNAARATGDHPGAGPARHVRFTIGAIDGTGGTLVWRDRGGLGTGAVTLSTFHADAPGARQLFTLYVAGRHGDAPFALSLASDSLRTLGTGVPAAAPFTVRGALSLGGGSATAAIGIDGSFLHPLRLRGFAGTLHATVPSLAALNAFLPHAALPPAADIALAARFGVGPSGGEVLDRITLSGAAADLGTWHPGLALARFAIGAAGPDAPITADVAGTLAGEPFTVGSTAAATLAFWQATDAASAPLVAVATSGRSRIAFDGALAREAGTEASGTLSGMIDADVTDPARIAAMAGRAVGWHEPFAVGGTLRVARDASGTVSASLASKPWTLDGVAMPSVTVAATATPHGTVVAHVTLPPAAKPFLTWTEDTGRAPEALAIALDGRGLPAGPLLWALLHQGGIDGRLDVSGTLTGAAHGARPVLATLSGPIDAVLGDATLSAAVTRAWFGPLLADARVPTDHLGPRTIRCAGVTGTLASGLLHASSLSLDDRQLVLNGSGTVDFRDRTLDLALQPVLRLGGIGASAPVTLTGPFAHPASALAPDAAGRFTLSIGQSAATPTAACDQSADLGPAPPPAKAPRAIDVLRSLGLFR